MKHGVADWLSSRCAAAIVIILVALGAPALVGAADHAATPEPVSEPFIGQWTGTATEIGGAQYPMSLSITGGLEGEVIGTVDYPSFPCSGEIVLWLVIDESQLAAGERLTSGRDVCASGGFVHITHNNADDTILFEVMVLDLDVTLSATLERTRV